MTKIPSTQVSALLKREHKIKITADQINGDRFLYDEWGYANGQGQYIKKNSYYSITELNIVPLAVPEVDPYNSNKVYVAEIDQYYNTKNFIFTDELKYTGFYRGQSAAGLEFKSNTTGKEYAVFLTDFDVYVGNMILGVVKGNFTFSKRGAKFGLRMLQ